MYVVCCMFGGVEGGVIAGYMDDMMVIIVMILYSETHLLKVKETT